MISAPSHDATTAPLTNTGGLLANRHGQDLVEHPVLVARLAAPLVDSRYARAERLDREARGEVGHMRSLAFLAGLLHDIGTLDPLFQRYLREWRSDKPDAEDDVDRPPLPDDPDRRFSFDTYRYAAAVDPHSL